MRASNLSLSLPLLAALLAACAEETPSPTLVDDLRVVQRELDRV